MNIQSISVNSLTPLEVPQKKLFDSRIQEIKNNLNKSDEMQKEQALHAQAQTQAHTVYRSGNEIIGVLWQDGSASFSSNSSAANQAILKAYDSNELQSLTGQALTDKMAQIIDKAFLEKYGSKVEAQTYTQNDAPNRGYLSHQIEWMQDYSLLSSKLKNLYA
jgi:hypothetical protein